MRLILPCLAAACALLPVSLAAMPPPVPLSPLVLSTAEDSKSRAELVQLIEAMAREGHFALNGIAQDDLKPDACWKALKADRDCLKKVAPTRVELEPELTVVIDEPHWRQASTRIRCVGPDVDKAREVQVYLSDARTNRPNALQQKATLAGCMIGSLYGAPVRR